MTGRLILNEYIGVGDEPLENRRPARRLGSQRQALLTRVQVEKQAALLPMWNVARKRRMAAGLVALSRRFELDHFGAHVGEHLAAHRPRHHLRVFDHPEVIERSFWFVAHFKTAAANSGVDAPPITASRMRYLTSAMSHSDVCRILSAIDRKTSMIFAGKRR